jgi:hypothetical protein
MDALDLARFFHDTYERLAPEYGYETRTETREFRSGTANGRLMQAVCAEVLRHMAALAATRKSEPITSFGEFSIVGVIRQIGIKAGVAPEVYGAMCHEVRTILNRSGKLERELAEARDEILSLSQQVDGLSDDRRDD